MGVRKEIALIYSCASFLTGHLIEVLRYLFLLSSINWLLFHEMKRKELLCDGLPTKQIHVQFHY